MAESLSLLISRAMLDTDVLPGESPSAFLPGCLQPNGQGANTSSSIDEELDQSPMAENALPLIKQLCEALDEQKVRYCHWKSNWALDRWMSGESDLDLLVDRADAHRFTSTICSLGFKQGEPPSDRGIPGILNFCGFDWESNRFVHLHVHYQLVLGHDLTKNYHLPIEKLYLESVTRQGLIPLPAPELEFVVFVVRMVLKHQAAAEIIMRRMSGGVLDSGDAVQRELEYLEARTGRAKVYAVLANILPAMDADFFERCVQSLRTGTSFWIRTMVRRRLQRSLRTNARRPHIADALLKIGRPGVRLLRKRLFGLSARKRLVNGGVLVALVGAAGKTTAINTLNAWLAKEYVVRRFHFGNPRRSPLTLALVAVLRSRRWFRHTLKRNSQSGSTNGAPVFPGYLQLLLRVGDARDRRRAYINARRFATNGAIALCDRYVVPQFVSLEGLNIARSPAPGRVNKLIKVMLDAETWYHRQIMPPDLLFVLRVDPETAVRRKTDERESQVRSRAQEPLPANWENACAHIIDASQPHAEVAAQLRPLLWDRI